MKLRYANFSLLGATRMPFNQALHVLISLADTYNARRLIIWDDAGNPNVTTLHEGGVLADILSILEFNMPAIQTISGEYNVVQDASPGQVLVGRRDSFSMIDGHLPVGDAIRLKNVPEIRALTAYADFALAASVLLQVDLLLATDDEPDEDGSLPPRVFAVFPSDVIAAISKDLEMAGAVLDFQAGYVRVWLQRPDLFVVGQEPHSRVLDILSNVISEQGF